MQDAVKTIGNLIDKQSNAFISSVDEQGYPQTKAMLAPRLREGIKILYFTTNLKSRRVAQYRDNPKACLYFCDKRFFRGVMLQGSMEVLTDAEHKRLICRASDTIYYSQGVDDPDYCVLRFTAECGRYYRNFRSEDFIIY